jgi:hypothetical protein
MTKWRYEGDEELVFPALGIIVKNGDVFEGPDNLTLNGLVEDKKAEPAKSKNVVIEETEVGE